MTILGSAIRTKQVACEVKETEKKKCEILLKVRCGPRQIERSLDMG
jgi:hypothetical protein